ncbi:MAG: serine hydrolase [Firmicutes bacterium]|nr:serine hydrolase [Bacillota bacterium]
MTLPLHIANIFGAVLSCIAFFNIFRLGKLSKDNLPRGMIDMKKFLTLSLIGLLTLMFGMNLNPASASAPPLDATDLEAFLDSVIAEQMAEFDVPNLTVSVVASGEVILAKGYGFSDIEKELPVAPDKTLFRIGSTSKLFTWTAVMQLVEQGKLDLDTDVNQYLDFEIPSELEYGRQREDVGPITLRHLMSHTPGFEDKLTGVFSLTEEDLMPLAQYVREQRPARLFPPGEVSAYSNYGTILAGYIVEVVSGVPFSQYVEEFIYSPLGMKNSTFEQPLPAGLAENMSKAYRYVDGEFREGKFEFMSEPSGSMSSSASDMARFMLAYLQGGQLNGETILLEQTVSKMFSEQFTHHPRLDGMAHGFLKATVNSHDVFHIPVGLCSMIQDSICFQMKK